MTELVVIAVGLALDATAVTASLSAAGRPSRVLLLAAVVFGLFQGAMAGLGALGGEALATWAGGWDHWLAAGLLMGVGVWLLVGRGADLDEDEAASDDPDTPLSVAVLLGLAVATSIDALSAGVGIPHIGVGLFAAVLTIGLVTTGLCGVGGAMGSRLSAWAGAWSDRVAGLVLLALAARVAVTPLFG